MIALALVALLAAPTCPAANARAELLAVHEAVRQAHLRGDPAPLADAAADEVLFAEKGVLRRQSRAGVGRFFASYFKRVRYREWRDVSPPVVVVSPEGQLAWMAVEIEARFTQIDNPAAGEKRFKSSWIATYRRDNCAWRMTAIASDVVE